jgi:hypothetical protein
MRVLGQHHDGDYMKGRARCASRKAARR